MNLKLILTTSAVIVGSATAVHAEEVDCIESTRSGYRYVCSYGEFGRYSQLNTELSGLSNDLKNAGLCVPTAIAGALDQLLANTTSVSGSWIRTSFEPATRRVRIMKMADEVGWIEGEGTKEAGMDFYQNHATDIDTAATGHKDLAYYGFFTGPTAFTDTYFRAKLQGGEHMVIVRVKYEESCSYDWWNHRQCNYAVVEGSGHAQAVNGTFTRDSDGMWRTRLWQSHNSSGPSATAVADEMMVDFVQMPVNGYDDHRPLGAYTYYYKKSGDIYFVIKRVHRIATH